MGLNLFGKRLGRALEDEHPFDRLGLSARSLGYHLDLICGFPRRQQRRRLWPWSRGGVDILAEQVSWAIAGSRSVRIDR